MRVAMLFIVLCLFANITPAFSADPNFDGGFGVNTFYRDGTDRLFFLVWVKDSDGVTPTSHTVTVTHPGGKIDTLNWWEAFNLSYARWNRALFVLSYPESSVVDGGYVFTLYEGGVEKDTFTDTLTSNPLQNVPILNAPVYYEDEGEDLVSLSWSSVLDAVYYQVKVAVRYGENPDQMRLVHTFWVEGTTAVLPEEFLAPECGYLYYVIASREDPRSGPYKINNLSRSEDFYFTTPETGYDTMIPWFKIRHRTHEDDYKPDYNTVDFILETTSGGTIPQDVLKTIELFDPNNNPVSISAIAFYSHDYEWRKGVYDENEDVWNYNDSSIRQPSYSGVIYDPLIPGTYQLKLTDAYGKPLIREFTFNSLPQPLPIISLDTTFTWNRDIWNNLHFSWEIPTGVFPEGSYIKSRMEGDWNEEGPNNTWIEIYLAIAMTSPTSLNQAFIPSHVAETLLTNDLPVWADLSFSLEVRTENQDRRARSKWISLGTKDSVFSEGVIPEKDDDSDGICNKVDVSEGVRDDFTFSNDFSDGTTTGTITDRGSLIFDIKDVNYPEGVSIATTGSGQGEVETCDGSASYTLNDADEIVVTCGSAITKVISGTVEIEFEATDGTIATTTLDEGNELEFDPDSITFTADESNPDTIVVNVDGVDVPVAPGDEMMSSEINIRPYSSRNIIILWWWGRTPIAILSNPYFDAPNDVDKSSITFGKTGDEDSFIRCKRWAKDVNGDGLPDLIAWFRNIKTGFEKGDTIGILKCMTNDGTLIQGSDSVRILTR